MSTPILSGATSLASVTSGSARTQPVPARLVVLDVLRGVALSGIVWLNIPGITRWTYGDFAVRDVAPWLELLLRGRFVGLFALLFGMSFALVLRGAAQRTCRPRQVLVRRFGFLLLLGLLHMLLQPGEVLTFYAVIGLVLLLPLSYCRWSWLPLVLGVAALVVAAALHLDPGQNAVGMVLLGYGAARLGLPERLERPGRPLALVGLGLLPVYAAAVVLQRTVTSPVVDGAAAAYTWADFAAGVVGAACYGTVVVLALRTRLRPLLVAVFEPLGRLALTNYIGATLLGVLARILLPGFTATSTGPDLLLAGAIVIVQVPVSRWWLARFRYGPLEWAWRRVTWWQLVPNARSGLR